MVVKEVDRQEQRRAAFIDVGVRLLGAIDARAVGVREICREAGITERYFYAIFNNRDGFVTAVYVAVAERALAAITEAVTSDKPDMQRADDAVRAFVDALVTDPNYGRVLLVAPASEQVLTEIAMEAALGFVRTVREQIAQRGDDAELDAYAIVGGLTALFTAYLRGDLEIERERFESYCVELVTSERSVR